MNQVITYTIKLKLSLTQGRWLYIFKPSDLLNFDPEALDKDNSKSND